MSLVLNKEEVAHLRTLCQKSEKAGALTPALLNIIYERQWFKLFVPKHLNGLELSLPEALRVEEALAYVDGSLGWTVTLCAGANLFVGYIEEDTGAKIFSKKNVCLGGSGAVNGVARLVKNGYIINGCWKYATGAPHLTHFTANCIIEKDGKTVLTEQGQPLVRSFFFKKNEVEVLEDWNTIGLRATASHSFRVKDLKVKPERSFIIDTAHTTLKHDIYHYPFMSFAETTIAVNTLGMVNHLLEETNNILLQRFELNRINKLQFKEAKTILRVHQQKINKLATDFYKIADHSWAELLQKGRLRQSRLLSVRHKSRLLVQTCRQAAAEILPYCGLFAANENTEVNKIFRDIFTASQHGLLTFSTYR
ncbi:acyl-CoA dehydrogenase [Niabella digestorum]|jgi:Acyl-CoA dehydrogenases|uniref:Acyl-CoA dehydrogenase n=1 Tax=Niabella digestorum TaxID=3117701 RepID=A0ABU7RGX5_9BACT